MNWLTNKLLWWCSPFDQKLYLYLYSILWFLDLQEVYFLTAGFRHPSTSIASIWSDLAIHRLLASSETKRKDSISHWTSPSKYFLINKQQAIISTCDFGTNTLTGKLLVSLWILNLPNSTGSDWDGFWMMRKGDGYLSRCSMYLLHSRARLLTFSVPRFSSSKSLMTITTWTYVHGQSSKQLIFAIKMSYLSKE